MADLIDIVLQYRDNRETYPRTRSKKKTTVDAILDNCYYSRDKYLYDNGVHVINRPDFQGLCGLDKISKYGSYARLIIDENNASIAIWIIDYNKEMPDLYLIDALSSAADNTYRAEHAATQEGDR